MHKNKKVSLGEFSHLALSPSFDEMAAYLNTLDLKKLQDFANAANYFLKRSLTPISEALDREKTGLLQRACKIEGILDLAMNVLKEKYPENGLTPEKERDYLLTKTYLKKHLDLYGVEKAPKIQEPDENNGMPLVILEQASATLGHG